MGDREPRRDDFIVNMRWVAAHRTEYDGQWVVLLDGALIDSDRSLEALSARVEGRADARELLLVKVMKLSEEIPEGRASSIRAVCEQWKGRTAMAHEKNGSKPLKIYVASKFENKSFVREIQNLLREGGHTITHDWTNEASLEFEGDLGVSRAEMKQRYAIEDVIGVQSADLVLLLDYPGLFGTLIEFGVAVACKIPILFVANASLTGHRSSIFLELPNVHRALNAGEALAQIHLLTCGGLDPQHRFRRIMEESAAYRVAGIEGIAALREPPPTPTPPSPAPPVSVSVSFDGFTWDDYQRAALRTLDPNLTHRETLALAGLGIGGEAGEVLEVLKKHLFHDARNVDRKLQEELGDLFWYLAALLHARGFSLSAILRKNIRKLLVRRPSPTPAPRLVEKFKDEKDEKDEASP